MRNEFSFVFDQYYEAEVRFFPSDARLIAHKNVLWLTHACAIQALKFAFDKVQNPTAIIRIVMQMTVQFVLHEGLLSEAWKILCAPFTKVENLTALYLLASFMANQKLVL